MVFQFLRQNFFLLLLMLTDVVVRLVWLLRHAPPRPPPIAAANRCWPAKCWFFRFFSRFCRRRRPTRSFGCRCRCTTRAPVHCRIRRQTVAAASYRTNPIVVPVQSTGRGRRRAPTARRQHHSKDTIHAIKLNATNRVGTVGIFWIFLKKFVFLFFFFYSSIACKQRSTQWISWQRAKWKRETPSRKHVKKKTTLAWVVPRRQLLRRIGGHARQRQCWNGSRTLGRRHVFATGGAAGPPPDFLCVQQTKNKKKQLRDTSKTICGRLFDRCAIKCSCRNESQIDATVVLGQKEAGEKKSSRRQKAECWNKRAKTRANAEESGFV